MPYDTLLVSRPENIRYLSGFTGEGVLLIKKDKRILITDARYALRARAEQPPNFQLSVVDKSFSMTLVAALKTLRTQRLGFEVSYLTVAQLSAYRKQTKSLKLKFVPTMGVIEAKRAIKSTAEIQKIRKACRITVRVLRQVLKFLRIGQTELAVAEQFRRLAFDAGASELAFDSIVAFGEDSACPHAQPSSRRLKKGDVVLFDVGVKYAGYCADMTRTFFTAPPTKLQEQVYEAVRAAQAVGVRTLRSGVPARAVDAEVREALKRGRDPSAPLRSAQDDNLEKYFTHGTGHGVGLEIHEAPNLSLKSKDILKSRQVVTVEPGVYLAGKFGVRIEDTVLVSRVGAEILTEYPRQLQILRIG